MKTIVKVGAVMHDNWYQWLWGVLAALLAWLGKRLYDRMENAVTRAELKVALDTMRDDSYRMHDENRDTLQRIHERVDNLWDRG